MKYLPLLAIGAALMGASCNAQEKTPDGFTKLSGGLEYKTIVQGNDTQTAHPGDFAEINLIMKIGDSIVINTADFNNGLPVKQALMPSGAPGDLVEGLLKMKSGDSTIFRMNLDTLSKLSGQPRPQWATDPNANAVWEVKMVSLMNKEQNDAAMEAAEAAQKAIDDSLILDYFNKNNITNYKKANNGLYYVVTQPGSGDSPKEGQNVTVNYTGKMLNGEVFDSNIDPQFNHVEPFQFPLGMRRVISGWDEGVALMKKGEKATFYIPSHLGYGQRGAGDRIPPNSILIFDIELISFQ